ncbi:DNA/RNA non-specific endonuclease [Pedobacter duraquae]|uniref:Endonuclease G n=1 Tax=Pedobacter duraquae TaxID=425511 RepID=A0A4V3C2Z4_9SPHI|nr:DNA/RNA non-specific endonuclease [Pedobacter duraquae]TDO20149.1 endonuclease G [Pedobacter duraquae]
MSIKNFILYAGLAIGLAGCAKSTTETAQDPVLSTPKSYKITEDFENAVKGAYALGDATMPTGTWSMDNALIGNLAADLKNGNKSVRMRSGKISMNFDIEGLTMVYISHGKYGTDPASTWQLYVSADGGTNYTALGAQITETSTKLVTDSFKVSIPGKLRFRITSAGSTDAARINLDDIIFKGSGDPGIVVGTPDTAPADTVKTTTPEKPRTVVAGADAQPMSGDNSNMIFGNPSNATSATADNFYIDQKYYTESYSNSRGTPNWVSWHLDASTASNAVKRLDNFAGFSGLPASYYIVQNTSYSGTGFDRGHNCPSGDRTSSTNANSATFLMTNMIPQAPQNNQQTWESLESYLRAQVILGNEVFIIMGSYGAGGVGSNGSATTINGGKVTVPSNVWKIAVILPVGNGDLQRVDANTRVIAVNTPNINTIDKDWKKYRVTVRDIEKATGYNFLSALSQSVQDAVETKKDTAN